MIKIQRRQFVALERARFEDTCGWVAELVRETFPDAKLMPVAELEEGVAPQVSRAVAYGLERDDQVAIYAMTAWVLGEDFPERFTAAGAVLNARDTTPEDKTEWLEQWTQTLLEKLEEGAD